MYMGNWADLPPELLDIILSKVFAKNRFRLVCRSWNAAAMTSPYGHSVPCMMYYYRRTNTWKFHLHNTSFFTSFPQLKDAEILCSKYGWLLMARNDNTLFFFDPSSNRVLDLPCSLDYGYKKKVFFFHPPTSPECIVVGIGTRVICTLKRGEYEWDRFEFEAKNDYSVSHGPPVLHRGQIYFSDAKGNVARFNIINRRLIISDKCMRLQPNEVKENYFFKVKGEEDLFGVFVFHDERKVKVFRLSEGPKKNMNMNMKAELMPKKLKWELVEDIGDNVLYLTRASSFGCTADTKTTGNRIYFPMLHGDSAVYYSFSDEKYHSVDGDYSSNNAYGLKRLDFAAWVMPSSITTTPEPNTTELRWTIPQADQHEN